LEIVSLNYHIKIQKIQSNGNLHINTWRQRYQNFATAINEVSNR